VFAFLASAFSFTLSPYSLNKPLLKTCIAILLSFLFLTDTFRKEDYVKIRKGRAISFLCLTLTLFCKEAWDRPRSRG